MADPPPNEGGEPIPDNVGKRELTLLQKNAIIKDLLGRLKNEGESIELRRGALSAVAKNFFRGRSTIRKIWILAKENSEKPEILAFTGETRKKGRVGRKKKWNREQIKMRLRNLPIHMRKTFRSMSAALNIPKSTLHKVKTKEKCVIIPHRNAIKPVLTEKNKYERMRYAVEHTFEVDGIIYYDDYDDTVFIDEKWFFISEKDLLMYLTEDEEPPERFCKHKNHILKVMFICAVARPRYD